MPPGRRLIDSATVTQDLTVAEQIKLNAAGGGSGDVTQVVAGNTASTARPVGATMVIWIVYSAFTPDNAEATDIVIVTSEPEGPDTTPPGVPTGLVATPGDEEVVLEWDENEEPDFNHYEYRVDGGTPVSTGVTLGATVGGLTNDQEYDFEVRAVDDSDNASAWSAVVSATPTAPAPFDPIAGVGWQHAYWAEGAEFVAKGYADGATMATTGGAWPDEIGTLDLNANNTSGPTLTATLAALNNKPAINYSVSTRSMVSAASLTMSGTGGYSFVLIMVGPGVAGPQTAMVGSGAGSPAINAPHGSGTVRLSKQDGTTPIESAGDIGSTGHLILGHANGASSTIEIDGAVAATGTVSASAVTGRTLTVGAISFNGYIAFAGVFSGDAKTDPGWAAFENWVESHYGITVA